MILGIDPGYANCGWAIVEPGKGRVLNIGLVRTMKVAGLHPSADRAVRVGKLCDELAAIVRANNVTTIAAEQPLSFGAPAAIVANVQPWGAIVEVLSVHHDQGRRQRRRSARSPSSRQRLRRVGCAQVVARQRLVDHARSNGDVRVAGFTRRI